MLVDSLQGRGLGVALAGDGEEALTSVRAALPQIVLLDLPMPVINGWTFCAAFQTEHPAIPL